MTLLGQMRVAVIFGGRSPEHEVSIVSARYVSSQLKAAGYDVLPVGIGRDGSWNVGDDAFQRLIDKNYVSHSAPILDLAVDVIFPLVHGYNGEDGTLAAYAQVIDKPCVGGDVLNSSLCWDKIATRVMLMGNQVPQLPYLALYKDQDSEEDALQQVLASFHFPVFVKPARTGSSIGLSRATDADSFREALRLAFKFDYRVIVEPGLDGAREIEIAGLGGFVPELSPIAEIVCDNAFYDYEEKYIKNTTRFNVPAQLGAQPLKKLRYIAKRAWRLLNCFGMARIDFLVTEDEVYLNEINTYPGFTSISMYPRLMLEMGVDGPQLMRRLVELAIERHQQGFQATDFENHKDWYKA